MSEFQEVSTNNSDGPSLSIVRPCSKPVRKGLDLIQYVKCLEPSDESFTEKEKKALETEKLLIDDEEDVYNIDKMLQNSQDLYSNLEEDEIRNNIKEPKVLLNGQVLVLDNVLTENECDSLCENILRDPLLSFWCSEENKKESENSDTKLEGEKEKKENEARSFRDASTIEFFSFIFAQKIWRRISEKVSPYLTDLIDDIEDDGDEIEDYQDENSINQFLEDISSEQIKEDEKRKLIQKHLNIKKKILKLHGYDYDDDYSSELIGTWQPCSLNPDMLFAYYPSGGGFSPHTDGNAILNFNNRSRYSVVIYLNTPGEPIDSKKEKINKKVDNEGISYVLRDPIHGMKRSNDVGGGTRFYRAEATTKLVKIKIPNKENESIINDSKEVLSNASEYYWGINEDERIDSAQGDVNGNDNDVSLAIGEIVPKKGRIVIFHQRLVHASVPVVKNKFSNQRIENFEESIQSALLNPYKKFIIRSDIINQRKERLCDDRQGRLAYRLYQKAEKLAEEERGKKLEKERLKKKREDEGIEEEEEEEEDFDVADELLFNGNNEPESVKLFKKAFKMCREMAELMGHA